MPAAVLDEIVLSDSNALEACEIFVERMQALQPDGPVKVKIYGDAAGEARSTAGKSDYQIIREFFARRRDSGRASMSVAPGPYGIA